MMYRERRRLGAERAQHLAEKAQLQAEFSRKNSDLERFADEILKKDTKQRQFEFRNSKSKGKVTNNYVKYLTLRKKESLKNALS